MLKSEFTKGFLVGLAVMFLFRPLITGLITLAVIVIVIGVGVSVAMSVASSDDHDAKSP